MKIRVIAVGTKMPQWVVNGVSEYQKRLPREWKFEWLELPLAHRGKSQDVSKAIELEGKAILKTVRSNEFVVALELKGKIWSTEQLSQEMDGWQMQGQDLAILIGGPDGLSDACRDRANTQWSLSNLTLPHPLVRILLVEQLYRSWAILNKHPYHK